MKSIYLIFMFGFIATCLGQTKLDRKHFEQLEAQISMGTWDNTHSDINLKVQLLGYNFIPKALDFRGTVVEALKWSDLVGEKILIQTVTGRFDTTDDSDDMETKSELYVYLFEKKRGETKYSLTWRIYDFTVCFGVDMETGFIPKSTTITDLNLDGIAEITVAYYLICRGGMDPAPMKIIMYDKEAKYVLRGETKLYGHAENLDNASYGGSYTASQNLTENKLFENFMKARWKSLCTEHNW